MDSLVEWLNAQLDADERTAEEAGESHIAWLTYRDEQGHMLYTTVAAKAGDVWIAAGKELPAPASVLMVYDSAAVLADIASKRKIMNWGVALLETDPGTPAARLMFTQAGEDILKRLAEAYAARDGYRKEWRP